MSIQTLFIADMTKLKQRLRLTGVKPGSDAQSQIDLAVEDARVFLFNEDTGLGEARVTALLALVFAENAITATAIERTRANNLEQKIVLWLLLRRMPLLFQDASAVTLEQWNNEPLTRLSAKELQAEIDRLKGEIQGEIVDLGTGDAPGGIDVHVLEPEFEPPVIQATIFPLFFRNET